jgi:hypothetical protein
MCTAREAVPSSWRSWCVLCPPLVRFGGQTRLSDRLTCRMLSVLFRVSPIRGTSVKRSLHVVSTIGGSASFFVLFLAIGRVDTMFEHHTLPLGEWGGVVIALVVTVALCFVATAVATWGAGALPRLRLLCCIAIGGAAWFALMGLLSPR